MRTKIAVCMMALALLGNTAWAADKKGAAASKGPSAQETVEFINGLLACEIHSETQETLIRIKDQHSSATLTNTFNVTEFIRSEFFNPNPNINFHQVSNYTENISVKLSDLDTDVEPSNNNVKIRCSVSSGTCIKGEERYPNNTTPINATDWTLNFCDADKAQRATKAMKHLIEISGGKKSLF